MIRLAVPLCLGLIIACASAQAASNLEDKMRNNRINACIKLLQANDKALRNWWQGHCGTDELDEELANNPAGPEQTELSKAFSTKESVAMEADRTCANNGTPVAMTPKCGLGTSSLYPSLEAGAAIQIRLPEHKCGTFIPILFTNKTDFACNAMQTRIACVDVSHDDKTDRTTVRFSARRTKNAEATTIEFGAAELAQHNGRISDLITHPQFTIIPALTGGKSITKTILDKTQAQETDCVNSHRHSPDDCTRRARFQADANMQETIRRYRNPRHDSTKEAITEDGVGIVDFLRRKHVDQIEEQWLLFLSIAANEVGLKLKNGRITSTDDPIYGVSDAVDGNSGLTFGAHQIDLGANEDPEVKLFWDVIDAFKMHHPDAVLNKAKVAHDCIDLPLRLMTVGALALTYQASPRMTTALRSPEGVHEYNKRLLTYLTEETERIDGLHGLFRKSMIARILYADLQNQWGTKSSKVTNLATQADKIISTGIELNSCKDIAIAEDKLLATLIWKDPTNQSSKRNQYADRYEHIRDIVRSQAVHAGITGCS
jgi:hypothetical protein